MVNVIFLCIKTCDFDGDLNLKESCKNAWRTREEASRRKMLRIANEFGPDNELKKIEVLKNQTLSKDGIKFYSLAQVTNYIRRIAISRLILTKVSLLPSTYCRISRYLMLSCKWCFRILYMPRYH